MAGYSFRLAAPSDKRAIIEFVDRWWEEPHPLLHREELFEYYYMPRPGRLQFALCEQGGRLAAVAGYVRANEAERPDVWVSIWVADPQMRGSGLELMEALPRLLHCRTLACNNIRPETRPFYEFLGYATGRVEHYYRLADKKHYALARISDKVILPVGGEAVLGPLANEQALGQSGFAPPAANPQKDLWYIKRRYFAYPGQHYDVYAVCPKAGAAPGGLLATRTIQAEGTAVLRIADYIGPDTLLAEAGRAIDTLMKQCKAEYADFYCVGIDGETMRKAGFTRRAERDVNILPNYLKPPVYQNTDYYYFTSNPKDFRLCKADGDQERPRVV